MGLKIFLATEKFKPSLTSLMKLFVSWHLTVYVSFAILIDVTHVCVIVIVAVVFVVFVVVYNVVVFSGEDIGGQMREMAIFGVPCWGLMVSGGVQGSNDRAGSYRGPTALVRACHPQHRQNLRSPRSRPLWQLEALFCGEHRFEVQLFSFWCHFKKQIWNLRLNLSGNWSSRHDTPFIM